MVGPGGQGHGRDGRPSCCVALPTAPPRVSACKAGGGPHLWGYVRQRGRQVTAAWHLWDGGAETVPAGPHPGGVGAGRAPSSPSRPATWKGAPGPSPLCPVQARPCTPASRVPSWWPVVTTLEAQDLKAPGLPSGWGLGGLVEGSPASGAWRTALWDGGQHEGLQEWGVAPPVGTKRAGKGLAPQVAPTAQPADWALALTPTRRARPPQAPDPCFHVWWGGEVGAAPVGQLTVCSKFTQVTVDNRKCETGGGAGGLHWLGGVGLGRPWSLVLELTVQSEQVHLPWREPVLPGHLL